MNDIVPLNISLLYELSHNCNGNLLSPEFDTRDGTRLNIFKVVNAIVEAQEDIAYNRYNR